ncbi:PA1571 family protein [Alkanindiges sp. WGS2144]|uniref:PA1571 family protein n=1 Tax=Alkanindiges sp. WGS2144 TaxID=3366808 RepID=UPI00375031C0
MNAHSKVFNSLSQGKLASNHHAAGYLIGEQGEVLKITEAMIKHACQELKARCQLPANLKR